MSPELINLAMQIPLVGAFVWFALAMVNIQRKATEADTIRLLEHEQSLQAETHTFIESQNQQWRQILQIERERRKEAMDQGLREVDTVGKAIAKLAEALTMQSEAIARHDQAAFERHASLIDQIRNNGGQRDG